MAVAYFCEVDADAVAAVSSVGGLIAAMPSFLTVVVAAAITYFASVTITSAGIAAIY